MFQMTGDVKDLLQLILPEDRFIYKSFIMTFLIMIAYIFFYDPKWLEKTKKVIDNPWKVIFFFYTGYLFTSTIMGRYKVMPYENVIGNFNLLYSSGKLNKDLCINVLMFIPYTFLYLLAFNPPKPFRISFFISVGSTFFIESSQLLGWLGQFQVSDLCFNIIGGMIGYLIWYGVHKLRK